MEEMANGRQSSADSYEATVGELMVNFRDALISLVPVADRAQLPWRDDFQHDAWESMAIAAFDTFVRQPIEVDRHRLSDEYGLAKYDIDWPEYEGKSWLSPSDVDGNLAFIRFETHRQPFDMAQCVSD